MFTILIVVQILVSLGIIALVMLQQGKGANMGAAFGSGSAGTVFGARGSGTFFSRATAALGAVFFINCLLIASPLVRDAGADGDSLAEQIEQREKAEQAEKNDALVVEQIEKAMDKGTMGGAIEEPASDLPEVPAEPAAPAGNGDLPE